MKVLEAPNGGVVRMWTEGLVAGFPEWYKNQLLMKHFEKEETLG